MTEFIIIGAATIAVFSLFMGVMILKEKRADAKPPIHTCGNRDGCQCKNRNDLDAHPDSQKPCDAPNQLSSQHCCDRPD